MKIMKIHKKILFSGMSCSMRCFGLLRRDLAPVFSSPPTIVVPCFGLGTSSNIYTLIRSNPSYLFSGMPCFDTLRCPSDITGTPVSSSLSWFGFKFQLSSLLWIRSFFVFRYGLLLHVNHSSDLF